MTNVLSRKGTVLAVAAGLSVASLSMTPALAGTPVSAKARAYYSAGLQEKTSNLNAALTDFRTAALLAPTWEAPVYQEGVLLSVKDFAKAIPILRLAARLNPTDDTVWNILGWGYYVHQQYAEAEKAFATQLSVHPGSPEAQWGLANCYGNSQVRTFAASRAYLTKLLKSPKYHASAVKMLTTLPPDDLDATLHSSAPITVEDAIGMLLTYRTVVQKGSTNVIGADGKAPSPALQPYIALAETHGWLKSVPIPSFQGAATRLFIAQLLATYYGINDYDYIRPFPFTDMSQVSRDSVMVANSVVSLGLMTETSANAFGPTQTMSRSDFSQLLMKANEVMKTPPKQSQWLTPPQPPMASHPEVYLFTTSSPDQASQITDMKSQASIMTAVGLTDFPFIKDVKSKAVATIAAKQGTTYLVSTVNAGGGEDGILAQAEAQGMERDLILGNYNQNTNQADPEMVHEILSSATEATAVASEAVRLALSNHLTGITVDFENILPSDKPHYVAFVQTLRGSIQAAQTAGPPLTLMVCLPEQSSDNPQSAYDYEQLAKSADKVMLITYDEHTPGSKPGAITDIQNQDRVVKYALTQMPADKVLLGLADYGYDWSGSSGTEVSEVQAGQLAAQYHATIQLDPTTESSHFAYSDASGVTHTVWFTSPQSAQMEAGLVAQYGLAGIAVWHLGSDNSKWWQSIESAWKR